ncbi:MAG: anti-sigma factor domain-containing protein [Christensenella sp.]|nr:anti-sigma factor domain-containing protein [Christensenella sp.]
MKGKQSAIIAEIRGKYAAALTAAGQFIRVPNEGYEVGQAIVLPSPARNAGKRMRLGAYASMAAGVLLLLFGGWMGYLTPVGVVSLDVNPSIEYSINLLDRVLEITAVNGDGVQILSGMDARALLYRPVDDAIEATIATLRQDGYLAEETENDVVLSASAGDARHAEALAQRLNSRVSEQTDLTVYAVSVSRGEVESAHALGTSAGKLHFIKQLKESSGAGESFDPADWVGKPVREIIAGTKEHKKQQAGENSKENQSPKPVRTPAQGWRDNDGAAKPGKGEAQSGGSQPGGEKSGMPGKQDEKVDSNGGNGGGRTP